MLPGRGNVASAIGAQPENKAARWQDRCAPFEGQRRAKSLAELWGPIPPENRAAGPRKRGVPVARSSVLPRHPGGGQSGEGGLRVLRVGVEPDQLPHLETALSLRPSSARRNWDMDSANEAVTAWRSGPVP